MTVSTYLHLLKRLDDHVKDLGLIGKCKVNTEFRFRLKKVDALACILVADVVPTFESVATQFLQDEVPLFSYFEKTWIGAHVAFL